MSVTAEQRNLICRIPSEEHGHIVDAFVSLGRDPETIAIRQGIDLENVILILHAYGIKLGALWGDEEDDRGSLRQCPERVIKGYVDAYYPGIVDTKDHPGAKEVPSLLQYMTQFAVGAAGRPATHVGSEVNEAEAKKKHKRKGLFRRK